MTKYFTQFDESTQTIGTNLSGWTVRSGSPSRAPAYGDPAVVAVKRRYLSLNGASAAEQTVSWDAIDADANRAKFDIVTAFAYDLTTAEQGLIYARGTAFTDYYRLAIVKAGSFVLVKVVASAGTTLVTASPTFTAGHSYFVRFRGNGTTLQARVWDAALGMAGEPTTWDINTTDGSITAAGWIGLASAHATVSSQVFPFNFLAVATNGDSAVCPRTNTEYTAWLDSQSAQRCALAEMSATGYDSGGSPYTKTVNVYLANHGYTSHQQDTPSQRHYDNFIESIPTFRREMGVALSGQASVGFGDLVVSNPSITGSAGIRDDWLRMNWKRNYLKVFLGDPSWPKHDFRTVVYGRLGMPTAPQVNQIRFPIADLGDALRVNVSPTLIGGSSGYANQFEPVLYGRVAGHIEPPRIDDAGLVYQIHKTGINIVDVATGYENGMLAYDNYVEIAVATVTLASVNTATETMTATASHGLLADWRVIFYSGISPPGGINIGDTYYVISAGLTATDFRVSTTRGGSAVNLTATFPGPGSPVCYGYGYYFDTSAGTMTLVSTPAGRVTVKNACVTATGTESNPAEIYAKIFFTDAGLSLNFKDAASFTALQSAMTTDTILAGFWLDTTRHLASDAAAQLASGTYTWYGVAPDGLMQVGRLSLPAATSVKSFTDSDVVERSLREVDTIRPVDFETAQITHSPWFLAGGPLPVGTQYATQGTKFLAAYSYGAAGVPLDSHPDQLDAEANGSYGLLISDADGSTSSNGPTNQQTALVTLYKKPLGVYEFETRLSASQLSIGDTISLTHPRLGWKTWSVSDPASPDNTATIDSTKAVVIGIDTNIQSGRCKLKVFRQIPGYYPTTDLN